MPTQTVHLTRSPVQELARRLRIEADGEVLFDAASRGRYSTDASIYQIEPLGVFVPRSVDAAIVALQIASELGVAILARGAGTSQCGQTVGAALVIDNSKYLNKLLHFDEQARTVEVEPGMVLDHLNAQLVRHGLWYPVDVSTAAQATLGGMAGNNSCGSRSIRYGNMVHNVNAIEAWVPSIGRHRFGKLPADLSTSGLSADFRHFVSAIRGLAEREADEIHARYPRVQRRVGGYNLDTVEPAAAHNLAHLLVGSEGTLAYFRSLTLDLSPLPRHKALGVCHFARFYDAMAVTRHIVELKPCAVEVVDRTMIDLARQSAAFGPIVERFLRGEPDALLLVEFAGDNEAEQREKLDRLVELLADLGHPESVVRAVDPALQRDIWEVRKAGLNIMMSMKGDGKPVSFIEDCAVPLEHLAEYTRRLTEVFERNGTRGTWYAHASVGCLHVRPVLNMKTDGAHRMRAIAEEAAELVREYKGAYSGEHGDGLVRSEWIAPFFGPRLTQTFGELKALFDPQGLLNPGKIVHPSRMDDRTLFRFKPGYQATEPKTVLDWSAWGGYSAAAEMCNNNGACRKFDAGLMCPSYRVTGDEQHLTRGRANTLRLALSGQIGADALTGASMAESMALCVSCKGCRRECPTGVDMARMKVEYLAQQTKRHGVAWREMLVGSLPRYAPWASRFGSLLNLRRRGGSLARLMQHTLGFDAERELPHWASDPFRDSELDQNGGEKRVVLWADSFNRWFEPDNLRAALKVLRALGYSVHAAGGLDRPLCCGRTYLATGMADQARAEGQRMIQHLLPWVEQGVPVIGLEPSCVFTLRDELPVLVPGEASQRIAAHAQIWEEFLSGEGVAESAARAFKPMPVKALLHGHCHQKAFGTMGLLERAIRLVPEVRLETITSSCCGMAGAFGYQVEHRDVSRRMAEVSLLPAVRGAAADTWLLASGTSCRHQIADLSRREARHPVHMLAAALKDAGGSHGPNRY